jgi:hypothetical protein
MLRVPRGLEVRERDHVSDDAGRVVAFVASVAVEKTDAGFRAALAG